MGNQKLLCTEDTKASYIFVKINSSDPKQTDKIMKEVEQIREKEGLKVVIYDTYKIEESLEQNKVDQYKQEERGL